MEVWSVDGTNHTPVAKVADVGTGDAALLSTTSAIFTLSGLDLSLSPLTDYFLVAKGIGLVENFYGEPMLGYIKWGTSSASVIGFPSTQAEYYNDAWHGTSYTSVQMQITADAAQAPLPATALLVALGLTALGVARRKDKTPDMRRRGDRAEAQDAGAI